MSSVSGWWVRHNCSATGAGPTLISTTTVPLRGAPGPVRVFATGENMRGECGFGDTLPRSQFTRVGAWEALKVTDVAFGAEHSLVLTKEGHVYCNGAFAHGQCGDMTSWKKTVGGRRMLLAPRQIAEISAKVVQIAAGQYHSLALDDQGRVWASGANALGQCGVGHQRPVTRFELVVPYSFNKTAALNDVFVTRISAGAEHSVLLTSRGDVFSFGANHDNQCGVLASAGQVLPPATNASTAILRPTLLGAGRGFYLPNISAIAAADLFTAFAAKQAAPLAESAAGRMSAFGLVSKISTYEQVAFVIDISGSMRATFTTSAGKTYSRFEFIQKELQGILETGLREVQSFSLIRYNHRVYAYPVSGVMQATAPNVVAAVNAVNTWSAGGATYTHEALRTAFALPGLKAVYLLSDGVPSRKSQATIVEDVGTWNKDRNIPVHTIAFLSGGAESKATKDEAAAFLKQLAEANAGDFSRFDADDKL